MALKPSSIIAFAAVLALLSQSAANGAVPALPAAATARHAMVSTAQHYATDVGVHVLREGGNAIDAAVAIGYALAVVDPCCGNLGGGGFMTVHFAHPPKGSPPNVFLSMQVRAPLHADGPARTGYLSAAIPGSVAGFEYARAHWGTKSRAALIAPAIALARDGFKLEAGDVALIRIERKHLARDRAAAAIFLPHGVAPSVGSCSAISQNPLKKFPPAARARCMAADSALP